MSAKDVKYAKLHLHLKSVTKTVGSFIVQACIFTLEIKSGGVEFNGSKWLFIDRDHNITEKQRGLFEQARDGMFEVEKILNKRTKYKYRTIYILHLHRLLTPA